MLKRILLITAFCLVAIATLVDSGRVAAAGESDSPASLGMRIHKFDTIEVAAVYANAGGIHVDCPGKDEVLTHTFGHFQLVIDEEMITDMNDFLAAGGAVEIRFQSEGSIITYGAGNAEYQPIIRVFDNKGLWRKNMVETVAGPTMQQGIKHPYAVALTSDAVSQLQPGDILNILTSTNAKADSGGCESIDQAIAMWDLVGLDGTAAPDRPALFMEE